MGRRRHGGVLLTLRTDGVASVRNARSGGEAVMQRRKGEGQGDADQETKGDLGQVEETSRETSRGERWRWFQAMAISRPASRQTNTQVVLIGIWLTSLNRSRTTP